MNGPGSDLPLKTPGHPGAFKVYAGLPGQTFYEFWTGEFRVLSSVYRMPDGAQEWHLSIRMRNPRDQVPDAVAAAVLEDFDMKDAKENPAPDASIRLRQFWLVAKG